MRLLALIMFVLCFQSCKKTENQIREESTIIKKTIFVNTERKAQLKSFLQSNSSFNQSISFLVDFSYPSNRKRFIVYDVLRDSILTQGLVAHGSCENTFEEVKYSNTENSHCSSLGKYKIGYSYNGQYGLAYKLHGLDFTNDKAFERFVVLHAHQCVPNEEPNYEICLSWGCPTVSKDFLQTLKGYIDSSNKPILLWQYDKTYKLD